MSHRRLPRGRGTIIACDLCWNESQTGQVVVYLHRRWLRAKCGWWRGALRPTKHHPGTTGMDLCPACLAQDQASLERRRGIRIRDVRARRATHRAPDRWRP